MKVLNLSEEETEILEDYIGEMSEYLDSWSDSDWSDWSESMGGDYAAMVKLILNAGIAGDLHAKRDAIENLVRQAVLDTAKELANGIAQLDYLSQFGVLNNVYASVAVPAIKTITESGGVSELLKYWTGTGWAFAVADGLLPIGDIVYVVVEGALVAATVVENWDNIVAGAEWVAGKVIESAEWLGNKVSDGLTGIGNAVKNWWDSITKSDADVSEPEGDTDADDDYEKRVNPDVKDLKRLPDKKIKELGGEEYTQDIKRQSGKSKSDLYWNPKTGDVYTIPKQGGTPEWVDTIPTR